VKRGAATNSETTEQSAGSGWRQGLPRLRRGLALALAAMCAVQSSPAAAQAKKESRPAANAPAGPTPASIDRNGVLILVRTTLLALDQANKTGNYTVLRELGAPGFQANTDANLAEIFAAQRNQRVDLSGVAVLEPQLTLLPQIEPNGMLHMAGFFPSVPTQLNFELLFAPADRQWKVFGIAVNLGSSQPPAPDSPPIPTPAPSPERPEAPTAAIRAPPAPDKKK
jgi:hypothetical protein